MTFSAQAGEREHSYGLVVLQDEKLMRRIDAYARQEYDTEHPLDVCPDCGTIQPGYRYCKDCLRRISRKRGIDSGFWVQEVAGEGHHQEAFERIVGPALNAGGEGVHLWVTAALLLGDDAAKTVGVSVVSGGPAEHVGHIPEPDAAAVRRACGQVERAYERIVACKGLINGGFALDDGTIATYGIGLLLPPVSRFLAAAEEAIAGEAVSGERSEA